MERSCRERTIGGIKGNWRGRARSGRGGTGRGGAAFKGKKLRSTNSQKERERVGWKKRGTSRATPSSFISLPPPSPSYAARAIPLIERSIICFAYTTIIISILPFSYNFKLPTMAQWLLSMVNCSTISATCSGHNRLTNPRK